MLKRIGLLTVLSLISAQPLKAVFTHAAHLANGKQNIYFFHDTHLDSPLSSQHQMQVVNFAKTLGATIFTEEMTDMNTLRRYVHDEKLLAQIQLDSMELLQKEESDRFALRGLALFARSSGVDARNVDYRHWADALRSGKAISGKVAMQILDTIIREIKSYNDNPMFNAFYKESLDLVTREFKTLWDFLRNRDEPIADLCRMDAFKQIVKTITEKQVKDEQRKYKNFWFIYDSRIFDCLLLHALAQQQNEHLIVCAGSLHCELVSKVLQEAGFKEINPKPQSDSPSAINLLPFMEKVLNEKMFLVLQKIDRKEIMLAAIEQVVQESKAVIALPIAHKLPASPLFLILVLCCVLGAIGIVSALVHALYFSLRRKA